MKTEINPMLQHQIKATNTICDALFGVAKTGKVTLADKLDAAIALANRLDLLLKDIQTYDPESAGIEEARDFAQAIVIDVAGFRKEFDNPPELCTCGKCDSCVAARSDEHFDRLRDGQLCDEA